VSLNLSWNGVDGRACAKLAAALTVNSCLTSLDLSRTSIDSRSVKLLVGALRLNGTLTTLKVGVREYDNDSRVSINYSVFFGFMLSDFYSFPVFRIFLDLLYKAFEKVAIMLMVHLNITIGPMTKAAENEI